RDPEDVALEHAEPIGGPLVGGLGDTPVEVLVLGDDGLGGLPGVGIDLTLEERGELLAGHVPLVEQDERGAAGSPASGRHAISSIDRSTRSISMPQAVPTACATRSCTVCASSGTIAPCETARSSETEARPPA